MHIKRLINPIRVFFEILGIIQTLYWLGGSIVTTASILTFSQDLPAIVPIALLSLGISLLGISAFRTVYRYKLWNSMKIVPELDDVLKKALEIHIHTSQLQKVVVEQNKRKNIKTKVRTQLAIKFFDTLKIPINDLPRYVNPDRTIKKKLLRKMKMIFHLKDGEYFTVLPLLKDYGKLLNRSKLGMRDAIQASTKYATLKNEFMELQLKLNIPDKIMDDINELPELSYGLNSISIGINLINENRTWYKDIPDSYMSQKEESGYMVDTAYLRASMWVKNNVRRVMFDGALK